MSGKREKIKWYLITSALLYAVIFVAAIALFCLWLLSEWLHEWFPVMPYLFYFFIMLLAYVKILKVIGKKLEENGKIVLAFFTAISVILWIMASMLGIVGWSDFTAALNSHLFFPSFLLLLSWHYPRCSCAGEKVKMITLLNYLRKNSTCF
ncbi:MAG: hypothetical protein QXS56_00525 [Fervidicoccaceae archaeon]